MLFFNYRACPPDWDTLCRTIAAPADEAFVDTLSRLCTSLHDGHTPVFALNNPSDPADKVKPLPMRSRRIGGTGNGLAREEDLPVFRGAALPFGE